MSEKDYEWLQKFNTGLTQNARNSASWMSFNDWESVILEDLNYKKYESIVGKPFAEKALEACFYLYFNGRWR